MSQEPEEVSNFALDASSEPPEASNLLTAMATRTQLTLFVPQPFAIPLEKARRVLDPVQAALIRAHVTLCREDEIEDLDLGVLESRLTAPEAAPVTLRFGPPETFHDHGILLPCVQGEEQFQALRRWVLASDVVRRQSPHITLAHPRNPKSPGNTPYNISSVAGGMTATFSTASVIRQVDSAEWEVLAEYHLSPKGNI